MELGHFKNWMEWKEWNSAQNKKVDEPVLSFTAAKHTSNNEHLSSTQNKPIETSSTATLGSPNDQRVGYSQGIHYKKPTYAQRPTSVYRQRRTFHPYNNTSAHIFSCKKRGKMFTGKQYSTLKNFYKWINPDVKNKKDNSLTDTSSASSSSGESS